MKALLLTVVLATPYKLWWSLPLDDDLAIEVDDSEVAASPFATRWKLAMSQGCDRPVPPPKQGDRALRELKVETLGADGTVRSHKRCVRSVADWKRRLGAKLFERLDDELDAHIAFIHPRKMPSQPEPAK
jgi:hypothetical protein